MNEREMFRLFNNVEHIRIDPYSRSGVNPSEEDITLLSQFRQLRKMELGPIRVPSFRDLLSSFSDLTHLALSSVVFSDSGPVHVRALKLQRLAISLHRDSFPSGMRLDAPGLEYLMLKWTRDEYMYMGDVESGARNVRDALPLENIKTLNLRGSSWYIDVNWGKSWCS